VESSCCERAEKKSQVKIEKLVSNEAYGGGVYLSSLILTCHWGFELGEWITQGLDLDGGSDGLQGERIGVEQTQFEDVGNWSQFGIKSLLSRN
jgi:hypothetical protein